MGLVSDARRVIEAKHAQSERGLMLQQRLVQALEKIADQGLDVNLYIGYGDERPQWATDILEAIGALSKETRTMDHTLQEARDEIARERSLIGGIKTLLQQLRDKANAVPGLSADQQAAVNSIFDDAHGGAEELTSALTENTPAAGVQPGDTLPATPAPDASQG